MSLVQQLESMMKESGAKPNFTDIARRISQSF